MRRYLLIFLILASCDVEHKTPYEKQETVFSPPPLPRSATPPVQVATTQAIRLGEKAQKVAEKHPSRASRELVKAANEMVSTLYDALVESKATDAVVDWYKSEYPVLVERFKQLEAHLNERNKEIGELKHALTNRDQKFVNDEIAKNNFLARVSAIITIILGFGCIGGGFYALGALPDQARIVKGAFPLGIIAVGYGTALLILPQQLGWLFWGGIAVVIVGFIFIFGWATNREIRKTRSVAAVAPDAIQVMRNAGIITPELWERMVPFLQQSARTTAERPEDFEKLISDVTPEPSYAPQT